MGLKAELSHGTSSCSVCPRRRFAPGPGESSPVVRRGPPPAFRLARGELTRWVIVYGSCDNGDNPLHLVNPGTNSVRSIPRRGADWGRLRAFGQLPPGLSLLQPRAVGWEKGRLVRCSASPWTSPRMCGGCGCPPASPVSSRLVSPSSPENRVLTPQSGAIQTFATKEETSPRRRPPVCALLGPWSSCAYRPPMKSDVPRPTSLCPVGREEVLTSGVGRCGAGGQ